jgi:hypothetical protein
VPRFTPGDKRSDQIGSVTKHYDRATNARFRPDKSRCATGKSLIVLYPSLSLNQRVPGSSPGAPTKQSQVLRPRQNRNGQAGLQLGLQFLFLTRSSGLRGEVDSIARQLSPAERAFIEPALRRPKLPPPDKWPTPDEPKIGIHKDEESEQALLFEDGSPNLEGDHKRRVVFNERSAVPRRADGRRRKRLTGRPDLL